MPRFHSSARRTRWVNRGGALPRAQERTRPSHQNAHAKGLWAAEYGQARLGESAALASFSASDRYRQKGEMCGTSRGGGRRGGGAKQMSRSCPGAKNGLEKGKKIHHGFTCPCPSAIMAQCCLLTGAQCHTGGENGPFLPRGSRPEPPPPGEGRARRD